MNWRDMIPARYRVTTDPLKTERRLELAVIGLLLLLGLQVLFNGLGLALPPSPEPIAPAPESLRVGQVSPRGQVDREQSAEVRARPLFFATRRPLEPELVDPDAEARKAAAQKNNNTKTPNLKLVGVFGGPDSRGIIALEKGEQLRLMVGDEVSGWTLQKVDPESAVLVSGPDSFSVALKRTDIASIPESQIAPVEGDANGGGGEDSAGENADEDADGKANKDKKPDKPSGSLVLGGRR